MDIIDALHLSKPVIDELFAQARTAPTLEVCGLIDLQSQLVVAIRNISPEPAMYFAGHEEDTLNAMRMMSGPFAVYHSHPTARAVPSDCDRSSARHPYQVILSLRYAEVNAYRVHGGEWTDLATYQQVSGESA